MIYDAIVEQQTTKLLVGDLVRVIDELESENYKLRLHPKHPGNDVKEDLTDYYKKLGIDHEEKEEEQIAYDGAEDFALKKKLTLDEYERLKNLNAAIRLGINRKTIPQTLLAKALTADEIASVEYLYDVPHYHEILYGDGVPDLLKDYAEKVAKADFVYGQKERLRPKTPRGWDNKRRLSDKAASLYESAIETLGEAWAVADPKERHEIQIWLDTDLDDDTFDNPAKAIVFDDGSVPRVRGSSSGKTNMDPYKGGLPKLSNKIKRKICVYTVLVVAAVQLAFDLPVPEPVPIVDSESARLRLKSLLNNLHTERDF